MVIGSVLKTHTPLNFLERSDDLVIVCDIDNLPAGLLCCLEMGNGRK